jgi:hypothetical protein
LASSTDAEELLDFEISKMLENNEDEEGQDFVSTRAGLATMGVTVTAGCLLKSEKVTFGTGFTASVSLLMVDSESNV